MAHTHTHMSTLVKKRPSYLLPHTGTRRVKTILERGCVFFCSLLRKPWARGTLVSVEKSNKHTHTHAHTNEHASQRAHLIFIESAPQRCGTRVTLTWICHATHCNTLQHTATHCNTLQHTATHCNTLQHTATHSTTHGYVMPHTWISRVTRMNDWRRHTYASVFLQKVAQQHTATHCNTRQHTTTHGNTLQHTATHCNTHASAFLQKVAQGAFGWQRCVRPFNF